MRNLPVSRYASMLQLRSIILDRYVVAFSCIEDRN